MSTENIMDFADEVLKGIKKEYEELNTLNVMVLGKTGVGKSTLVNNIFNQEVVKTGIGKPVTETIKRYKIPDYPVAIYDTPGIELGGEKGIEKLKQEVTKEIDKGVKSGDINQSVHCILYCVSVPSHRIEDIEIKFLKEFIGETQLYKVPVIIVLTQAYSKKDTLALKKEIEKLNLDIIDIVPVLAEDYELNEDYIVKSYGLDTLSQKMYSTIPKGVQKTFVALQKHNMEMKKDRARAIVNAAATAAAITGATPIPFSDASILIPEQIGMLASITVTFGVPVEKATMVAIASATIGTTGTTILGKTIVANLIKLIPGAGSAIGGVISATTAAMLTTALGEAYMQIMIMVCENKLLISEINTEKGKEMMRFIFRERLKSSKQ